MKKNIKNEIIQELEKDIDTKYIIIPMRIVVEVIKGNLHSSIEHVYGLLNYRQRSNGKIWAGLKNLSNLTGFSISHLKRMLKQLKDIGFITRNRRFNKTSITSCKVKFIDINNCDSSTYKNSDTPF